MLVLMGYYRAPLIFNDETQDAAEKSLERIKSAFRSASASAKGLDADAASALASQAESTKQSFVEAMDDDFNTPLRLQHCMSSSKPSIRRVIMAQMMSN
jgi:cysteinyl-tRNA synthetase